MMPTLSLILFSPPTVVNGVTVQPFITLFAASTINVGGTQTTLNPNIRGITRHQRRESLQ